MGTVRCPKCGAINPDGRRRRARCHQCREWLGRCRYCVHYDPRLSDCTSPFRRADDRMLDADEVRDCPDFRSALAGGMAPAPAAGARRGVVAALALAVAAAGAMAVLRVSGGKEQPPPALRVSVDAPATVMPDEVLPVVVMVANQGERATPSLEISVSGRGLQHLVCQSVVPETCFVEATPRVVRASLGQLAPGEMGSVAFHFVPARAGEVALTVHVSGGEQAAPVVCPVECEVLP